MASYFVMGPLLVRTRSNFVSRANSNQQMSKAMARRLIMEQLVAPAFVFSNMKTASFRSLYEADEELRANELISFTSQRSACRVFLITADMPDFLLLPT